MFIKVEKPGNISVAKTGVKDDRHKSLPTPTCQGLKAIVVASLTDCVHCDNLNE